MNTLISLLIVVAVAVVLIWLIRQIPWPSGLEILGTIMTVIVVIAAIIKIWPLL